MQQYSESCREGTKSHKPAPNVLYSRLRMIFTCLNAYTVMVRQVLNTVFSILFLASERPKFWPSGLYKAKSKFASSCCRRSVRMWGSFPRLCVLIGDSYCFKAQSVPSSYTTSARCFQTYKKLLVFKPGKKFMRSLYRCLRVQLNEKSHSEIWTQ